MTRILVLLALTYTASGQTTADVPQETLSRAEVESALAGNGADRWITLTDNRLLLAAALGGYGSLAQEPSITILMPEAIIAQRGRLARKQFSAYQPGLDETQRSVVIVGEGIAVGSASGPQCSSIMRIALLSDQSGKTVKEADSSDATTEDWRNGFGATSQCQSLRAKFSLSNVRRVEADAVNGEFLVAVFYANAADPRIFKIKKRYLKRLGLN